MVDGDFSEPTNDTEVSTETEQAAPETAGNPAWEGLRSKLDPISFHAIEDDLKQMDAAAQQRITSTNEQFKPWKTFADEKITPEQISSWRNIADQINENPAIVYDYLGKYLQETGRMPSAQEVQNEVATQLEEPGEQPSEDPRIAQLEQQQQAMQQFIQEQAQAEVDRQAEASIDTEISSFRQAHQELAPEDVKEVLRRTALIAQERNANGDYTVPTLEEGFAELSAYRNRILATPRPGDTAPKLIPTSGGVPSTGGQKSLGTLSRDETQNLIAGLVSQNNNSGR